MEALFFTSAQNYGSTALFVLLGLLIGSFLNVVIHRLPIMMQRESDNYVASESGKEPPFNDRYNLFLPNSSCTHCGHKITALENIPVFSYLFLAGKCSSCKTPISIRYPVIELITGILTGLIIWHFGSGWQGLAAIVFCWILIACTAIDIDTQFLPDDLTLPLMWMGLLVNTINLFATLQSAVLGAAIGYLILWSVYWSFKLATGREGMGYGDLKLLAALGAWFGWQYLPILILVSSGVGSIISGLGILLKRLGFDTYIPFGPYLALAGMTTLFFGRDLIRLIMPGFL